MALLEVRNLQVNYGPIQAVKGIDLDVEKGTLVALLGANGAGKTTTLRAITGMVKAYGSVHLGETEILGQRGYKTARMGVNMSPEGRLIFAGLTVEENLKAGAYCIKSAKQYQKNMDRVQELFPILKERRRQQAGTLSGGEQQMLAIGRALMADPEILLLDEPSLGLAPLIIQDIFKTLQAIRSEGTTILMVEQNALATLKIADYGYVLELGKISMHGPASQLVRDERLIEAYLGNKK
ncbi:ABC transporter ATP-binding protein [Ruthenibacterium lactatiformans]|jgi:branched-chain amino acid transport system ATP-binding protein|uniref:ABC transporter ATP-binding protein n=1 Tax=Ruthenibacterium lactatiformans TaxID=1550024 RepID=UPI002A9E394B|nr:ABC transporter ATP-binding protein [Clostridiales bacterium]MDY5563792.1 ABC transporter ATP-binding protein [Candidatus Limivicinus sp.]